MPQFDKLTFLSQIFWMSLIFFLFYFIVMYYYLPRLARILKVRKKKLLLGSQGVDRYSFETEKVSSNYNLIVRNSVINAREGINQTQLDSLNWLKFSSNSINKGSLSVTQENYLKACANLNAKEFLSIKNI
jgi:hypothetical protein